MLSRHNNKRTVTNANNFPRSVSYLILWEFD